MHHIIPWKYYNTLKVMKRKTRKYTPTVERTLQKLGSNIRIARIERKMPVADLADRMRVSERTVLAIEAGKPGVAIGNVAQALSVLQSLDQLGNILDIASNDPIGDALRRERLPKRVRGKKAAVKALREAGEVDDEGYLIP